MNRNYVLIIITVCIFLLITGFFLARGLWVPVKHKIIGKRTTNDIIDPRVKELKYNKEEQPEWTSELYENISNEFLKYSRT